MNYPDPEPIENYCSECEVWYTDYWCEYCGYHGHNCGSPDDSEEVEP